MLSIQDYRHLYRLELEKFGSTAFGLLCKVVESTANAINTISLWGSPNNLQFSENPLPTEFADQVAPVPHMAVDSDLYVGSQHAESVPD